MHIYNILYLFNIIFIFRYETRLIAWLNDIG